VNLRQGSIREKLQAIVVFTTVAALIFALAGNIVGNVWSFHRQQVSDLQTQAELLGGMTAPALMFDDPALAKENLELFRARPNVRAAAIYNPQGRLFATYLAAGQEQSFPLLPGRDDARVQGTDIVVFKRIKRNGATLGTVYLRQGNGLMTTVLDDLGIAALVGLLALLIAFLLVRRLEGFVTRPIAAVASAARTVMEEGDYSRRVAKTSEDEVGELVESFNNMLDQIQRRTHELEASYLDVSREAREREVAQQEIMRLNESLEHRVQVRTAELEDSNRALSVAKAAADDASRAKSAFLATMSHEIRTPMNGVIGMMDVLHQTSLNGQQVEMVDLIRESAFSLLTIIDDILDFSKIEAGRLDLESAPMPIFEVIEHTCSMFDHLALKKDVELTTFVDPAIPRMLIGDALRLRQILANLLSNAIKFSSGGSTPGRVALRAVLVETRDEHALVDIAVIDNGIGIDEETRGHLFQAFSQADTSTTRRFGGTGLGLAISRHLVNLMGGEIALDSEPGKGSTFSVLLRLEVMRDAQHPDEAVSEVDGLRCLVVGDGDRLVSDVAAYLVGGGALVERVEDARQLPIIAAGLPAGPWVWVVDTASSSVSLAELRALARTLREHQIRFLGIGRGRLREPQRTDADLVSVDGNVMTRRRLFRAVATAAGRTQEEVRMTPARSRLAVTDVPTREEAQRAGRLILVAEDNETNQDVIRRQLSLLGYTADIATNGVTALERWQDGEYALLLTDLHMPRMDGYELTTAIRSQERHGRRMPIIAFTANALKGEAERCQAAGMDGYLTKPLQLSDLKKALDRWLMTRTSGRAVDIQVLAGLVGNDPGVILGFLQDFRSNAARIARQLRAACAHGDPSATSDQAHQLKSSARTVGALALGELCAQIELAGKAGNLDALAVLLPTFDQEFAEVDAFLDIVCESESSVAEHVAG
jgi:signal transduction histidine kinase/CheY-like chemotaxis protein/HPt (histidine-containing phosphotransfer) domain-containing protein